jgi:hypothetical protein
MQFGLPLSKVERPILTSRQMSARSSEIGHGLDQAYFLRMARTLPNTGRARFVGRSAQTPLSIAREEFVPAIRDRVDQCLEASVFAHTTVAERPSTRSQMRLPHRAPRSQLVRSSAAPPQQTRQPVRSFEHHRKRTGPRGQYVFGK